MNEQIHYYISFVECFEKLFIVNIKYSSTFHIQSSSITTSYITSFLK